MCRDGVDIGGREGAGRGGAGGGQREGEADRGRDRRLLFVNMPTIYSGVY